MTTPDPQTRRVHVVVRGRVQGVAFRYYTERAAHAAGIAGWVRNRADGAVEAVFEGSGAALEEMLAFARRGPPAAAVTGVELRDEPPRGERGFSVRPDAPGGVGPAG